MCAISIVVKVNILQQQGSLALTHAYNYKQLVDLFRKLFVCIRPPNFKTNLIDQKNNDATKPSSACDKTKQFHIISLAQKKTNSYIVCKIMCDRLMTISRSVSTLFQRCCDFRRKLYPGKRWIDLIGQNHNARQIIDRLMYNTLLYAMDCLNTLFWLAGRCWLNSLNCTLHM